MITENAGVIGLVKIRFPQGWSLFWRWPKWPIIQEVPSWVESKQNRKSRGIGLYISIVQFIGPAWDSIFLLISLRKQTWHFLPLLQVFCNAIIMRNVSLTMWYSRDCTLTTANMDTYKCINIRKDILSSSRKSWQ